MTIRSKFAYSCCHRALTNEPTTNLQTPHRSDSVKKPKIKLTTNSTPKAANGTSTPKSPKPAAETKASKSKSKKPAKEVAEPKKTADKKMVEKEKEIVMPELSLEEKLARKEASTHP